MERPELCDYKDEIHLTNGQIEDRWRHNDYVEDLNKYVDLLESKVENLGLFGVIHFKKGDNTAAWRINVKIKQIIKNLKLDEFIESDSQQFKEIKTVKQVATKDFDIYVKAK